MATYTCFKRAWYRYEYNPNTGKRKLVPHPSARRTIMATFNSESEAREYCRQYNETNKPGPTSIKCEYASNY